jgi:phage tail-like protein
MAGEGGYLYLNAGNAWPKTKLGPTMQRDGGRLGLLQTGTTFAQSGAFLAGPFQVSDRPTAWFRVEGTLEGGGAPPLNTHVQFFTFVSSSVTAPWNPASATPFTDPGWKAAPRDALDFYVPNTPNLNFFLGGLFRGDGSASPFLEQVQVFYGRDTYAKFLPLIYRQQPSAADFLERFLSIEQSVLSGIEQDIEDLPRLFDPRSSPAGDPPSWLGWLSGWLTFILDEQWAEAEARQNLAQAFDLYRLRGTIEGLRRYLFLYAGVNAIIEEPARETTIWSLGQTGLLGFSTMLAPGPLQGAVLNTSATADASHLTTGQRLGAALFEDVAHRFCVSIYCAELTSPGALDTVRAVLDREKPAHTTYELCVLEPSMRVGVQARVGIDAIVSAGPPPLVIGQPLDGGALAAHPQPCAEVT